MKVRELIELLQDMPEDFPVCYRDHRRPELYDILDVTQVLKLAHSDHRNSERIYGDTVVLDSFS